MDSPVAIEVRKVAKTFRIPKPTAQIPARQRLRHPLARPGRDLQALREISFDVGRGEFFGIVGRNGSGKSTLLKMLSGAYMPDRGTIRVAGRLAPFLELGVGFNPELPAYDNILLNGVIMGLSPAEARRRCDEIIAFAGLREFTDLNLKHYSSGMRVRLGFSVMTHVDADILVVDEVLAVGDAEFSEKCEATFKRMHDAGRTIVLVSHSMESVSSYCDRAMLIEDGRVEAIGDSVDVTNRYLELNLRKWIAKGVDESGEIERVADVLANPSARLHDPRLLDAEGERTNSLAAGEPLRLRTEIEVTRRIERPSFYFTVADSERKVLFAGSDPSPREDAGHPGDRFLVDLEATHRLTPGEYVLNCGVMQVNDRGETDPVARANLIEFRVAGEPRPGRFEVEHTISVEPVSRSVPR